MLLRRMVRYAAMSVVLVVTGVVADDAATSRELFIKVVRPVFETTCIGCHGPEKQKSLYRIDQKETAFKGGFTKLVAIVPGEPAKSELVRRIRLPRDDLEVMPPKEPALTEEQIQGIVRWVKTGAVWVEEEKPPPADDKPGEQPTPPAPADDKPGEQPTPPAPADDRALAALTDLGALAMPVAQNSAAVYVSFLPIAGKVTDDTLAKLTPLAANLQRLNLAGCAITDAGLATIGKLTELRRLHLERTQVTDDGLPQLAALSHLEYLNLYGTKVTDAGLAALKGLPKLKKVYLWQTGVTEKGVAELRKSHPGAIVDTGYVPPAEPDEPGQPANATTIRDVMLQGHKSGLLNKVLRGEGDAADKQRLVALYETLAAAKPPKGPEPSWKRLTAALLAAARSVLKGETEAIGSLRRASNCKACHKVHR